MKSTSSYTMVWSLADISEQEVLSEGHQLFTKWLRKLQPFLKGKFGREYKEIETTRRSVQFRFQDTIDVDLLVSPFWSDNPRTDVAQDPSAFYRFLQGVHPRDR